MTGVVCLQGGGEFSPGCVEMDRELLENAPGTVAVLALAAAPGREYAVAGRNGVTHFHGLGADTVAVPDPRERPAEAREAVEGAGLVVLPGGSPARLLEALRTTGMGELLVRLVVGGVGVMGASAGAMALCERLLLPEQGLVTAQGLGLVPGVLVVPHWTGARPDWEAAAARTGLTVLGIPEESGVLVTPDRIRAAGQHPTRLVAERQDLPPGVSSGMLRGEFRPKEGPW